MTVRILIGDCREMLLTLADCSVQTCVTSPPYFGLRDYGVDRQIGLESTPEAFVDELVSVFREVRRVLRDDGTLWLNLGDSYCSTGDNTGKNTIAPDGSVPSWQVRQKRAQIEGIKPKDLYGIPWMVAFALRSDGWYLRQEIIWSKPNPMPESIKDRCTKAHEHLFLLAKSPRYFYDADAIREESTSAWDPDNCKAPDGWDTGEGGHGSFHRDGRQKGATGNKARKHTFARETKASAGEHGQKAQHRPDREPVDYGTATRNKRSVWEVATQPFKEAHFATFPPALIEPCIKAGSREGDTVLDPFGGAGTTGLVADRLQRNAVLCELNPDYAEIARKRITGESPLFAEIA